MGTPDFASASLQQLLDDGFEIVGAFTQPDKPKGRGMELCASPVKELALSHGLPVFQPEKMRDNTWHTDASSPRSFLNCRDMAL